jgi:hypothetical protein
MQGIREIRQRVSEHCVRFSPHRRYFWHTSVAAGIANVGIPVSLTSFAGERFAADIMGA